MHDTRGCCSGTHGGVWRPLVSTEGVGGPGQVKVQVKGLTRPDHAFGQKQLRFRHAAGGSPREGQQKRF